MASWRFILVLVCVSTIVTGPSSALPAASGPCGGFGDANDWLVVPCKHPATLTMNGTSFVLSNGIVQRVLRVNRSTGAMYTSSVTSKITGEERYSPPYGTPLAEAEMVLNGVPVMVGGEVSTRTPANVLVLKFASYSNSTETVAGGFPHTPGKRGSRADRVWPPVGVRAVFTHTGPCASIAQTADAGTVTVHVVYELYQGISAFSKRVMLRHSCAAPLSVFNLSSHLMYHWNVRNRTNIEVFSDAGAVALDHHTFSSPGTPVTRSGFANVENAKGGPRYDQRFGPGIEQLAAGSSLSSFLVLEVIHDALLPNVGDIGMHRFGLETAVAYRHLAPQIEEFPVNMHAVCNGGNQGDGPLGETSAGYWCYDAEGTASMFALIDQAADVGIEMIVWGINMNKTWRSQVGVEFQSEQNITWFKNITSYAHSKGIETGSYQLLRNARSATAINQCAPSNHDDLPNAGYDSLDYPTSLGGTGKTLRALCAGTRFWDRMTASVLRFWDETGYSAVSQDGSETGGPICTNKSHIHHHGALDSIYTQTTQTLALYHAYKSRHGFIQGMPGFFLEGGQSKSPGGYSEITYSMPRWTWIHRSRYQMIASGRSKTRTNANRMYITPMVPYHPTMVDPKGTNTFKPANSYETSATLEPLDEHLLELEWALSQQYGTGIFHNLRGYRAYQSDKSKAVMKKWISWFKRYRSLLTSEFQTLQCGTTCDWRLVEHSVSPTQSDRESGRAQAYSHHQRSSHSRIADPSPNNTCKVTSWDGIVHWGSRSQLPHTEERAIVMVWNPLATATPNATISIPLYYSGLSASAGVATALVREQEGASCLVKLDTHDRVEVVANLEPLSVTWFVVSEVKDTDGYLTQPCQLFE